MADSRAKAHTILLSVNSKKIMLELFDADLWPDQNTGENLYRVRIDGRWHSPMGKYTFLTLAAVGELTASLLAGGVPVEPEALPEWMHKGAEVRAHDGECLAGVPLQTFRGYMVDHAQLGPDGRWYALCQLYTRGKRFIPAADLEPVRR
jgi:hypothetical protein